MVIKIEFRRIGQGIGGGPGVVLLEENIVLLEAGGLVGVGFSVPSGPGGSDYSGSGGLSSSSGTTFISSPVSASM